jgi:pilus assembly protein TadC
MKKHTKQEEVKKKAVLVKNIVKTKDLPKKEEKKDVLKSPEPEQKKVAPEKKEQKPVPVQKEKPIKRSHHEQKRIFSNFIKKAGIELSFEEINRKIVTISGILMTVVGIVLLFTFVFKRTFIMDALSFFLSTTVLVGIVSFILLWAGFFVFVDYIIYKRRKEMEAVFPDFLQLTAANINAGMPIDRALWFAIRPKFGILAKEMEHVAKATMVGENLNTALMDFSNKYDSLTIKRAMNLLLEGLESGGEIGDLLTRISNNLMETENLRKEMASGVTTYVIFILFATLGAAPFLFGLTTELIVIMTSIMSSISVGSDASSMGGIGAMMANAGGNSISLTDYQTFAIASICISATFAAIIISVIQKGEVKESFKKIPLYILIGVGLYFVAFKLMNWLLGGFFA